MTYCSDCIHYKVCGNEGVDDVSMTFCADKQPRWIPVNERLPKEYVPVMISTHHSVFPEARYSKKYGWQWAYSSDQGDWRKFEEQRVIAWMPLPEPYKAESEEEYEIVDLGNGIYEKRRKQNSEEDLNNPFGCITCKHRNNMTILRCSECEPPFWKNHEPREGMNDEEAKLEAFADFLNDIEQVAQKHGWNIGSYENLSDDKDFERVEITFIPALGYDSQFRKF